MNNSEIYKAAEIGITYKVKPSPDSVFKITAPQHTFRLMRRVEEMNENIQYKEMFYSLLLNQAAEVIAIHKIGEGSTNSTITDIKFILQGAIMANATNIIICHNHPSGRTTPSEADRKLTTRIKKAAEIFDIRLLDSVIISDTNYFSFLENCMLD